VKTADGAVPVELETGETPDAVVVAAKELRVELEATTEAGALLAGALAGALVAGAVVTGATAEVVGGAAAEVAGGGAAEALARRSGQTFGSSARVVEISAEVHVERTHGVAAEVIKAWLEAEQIHA